jgi:hypothetical protein
MLPGVALGRTRNDGQEHPQGCNQFSESAGACDSPGSPYVQILVEALARPGG